MTNVPQPVRFYPRQIARTLTRSEIEVPNSNVQIAFRARKLSDDIHVAVSKSGDHVFLSASELALLADAPATLPLERIAELRSRFFLVDGDALGINRLLESRRAAKQETLLNGPSLHIIVPTLQCEHSCSYCQVSRSLNDEGHSISIATLNSACDTIFESAADTLTVEFQGGDPLIRFDLVKHAIKRIALKNKTQGKRIHFVIASTLHHLTEEIGEFLKSHSVHLSTSVDGPANLHNRNRPIPGKQAYERTIAGIELARRLMGHDSVAALMTTTRASLEFPEAIVDQYVELGFREIFIRPLSAYGFAKRNQRYLAYSHDDFAKFYLRALQRVLYWNEQGTEIREVYASIILNKILSSFDGGYVDLQSPTGAGTSVLVYNYDGFVYPSDEARMLAETGDTSLRLGRVGQSLWTLIDSPVRNNLVDASLVEKMPGCRDCAYNRFCAPNPIDAQAQCGTLFADVQSTEHCQRHMWLFDTFFKKIHGASEAQLDLFYRWAQVTGGGS